MNEQKNISCLSQETKLDKKQSDNFWRKVIKTDKCWLWIAGKNSRGYCLFSIKRKTKSAHRISYIERFGKIHDGLSVLHKCDVRNCVNPDHLFLGTQRDNILDMDKKGRRGKASGEKNGSRTHPEKIARGERHCFRLHPEMIKRGNNHWTRLRPEKTAKGERSGVSKLKIQQVLEIRNMKSNGETNTSISKKFNVSHQCISSIAKRKTWKHLLSVDENNYASKVTAEQAKQFVEILPSLKPVS